jgi:hypothetical protein
MYASGGEKKPSNAAIHLRGLSDTFYFLWNPKSSIWRMFSLLSDGIAAVVFCAVSGFTGGDASSLPQADKKDEHIMVAPSLNLNAF